MKKLGPPYARPELRGRYLIREPVKAFAMGSLDLALSLLPRKRAVLSRTPKRILVCNWAHLGDVVLTIPAVLRLREAFPDARLDFLTQTGSQVVAAQVPGIDRIHLLDHWSLSRAEESWSAKRARYLRQRRAVVAELARTQYDLAIDFYQHYPTAAFELWRAGIPVRLGYSSGGMSPLLTQAVDWTLDDRHVIHRHEDLLKLVLPEAPRALAAAYPQPLPGSALKSLGVPGSYVLIHTGAGGVAKEWPEASWTGLIQALAGRKETVILAGAGPRESARNARLAASAPGVLDLTDRLDWSAFTAIVAEAKALIGLDSVSVHLGAAYGVPTVCIRSGAVSSRVWGPLNPRAIQLSVATPCAPCHRLGCDSMACLVGVVVADVLAAFDRLELPHSRASTPVSREVLPAHSRPTA